MKAVIFDKDGLMFDTEIVFVKAWDYAGEKIGIGKAGYMIFKTLGMHVSMARHIWYGEFGDKYNEQELRKYTREFITNYYEENPIPIKKGLYNLLDYLKNKGYKLAVASSAPRYEVEDHLIKSDTMKYFDVIICGDMVTKSKPDPEIYIKAAELLGEKPEDCCALEDSRSGLHSAYNAGCKPIMVPDIWQCDEETEKILFGKFNDLDEVKTFFESKNI